MGGVLAGHLLVLAWQCLLKKVIKLVSLVVYIFFMEQLDPGVLTKSNTEKGGWLTDSVPMSTRRQPSNPRLRLGLLGCHLVDIGMKLHSVHFAVKFSSASAAPRLRRTWLQSAPRAVSTQVRLSPISSRPRLAALDSADLKMDLAGLEPESVKSPSLHSVT